MRPASPPELHQVLYVSRAQSRDLAQIGRLHDTCVRNNTKLALTGLLLYTGGHFAQLLEGPPQALSDVMWRIARDDRHTRMRKLFTKALPQRTCDGWAMKLMVSEDADEQVRQLVDAAQPSIHEAAALLANMHELASRARAGA